MLSHPDRAMRTACSPDAICPAARWLHQSRLNMVVKRARRQPRWSTGMACRHLVVARGGTAIELAQRCGVAWVGCRMSGHAGAAGVMPRCR